ncbi:MAG: hydroxyacid dehydrogenase [Bacteroidetes bacterium]|nr:hydroxyacid dehydrogenase [Bacteroidota bacterium]
MSKSKIKKQLLILQDLGVTKQNFEELSLKINLPFEFINDKCSDILSPEMLEGIITVKEKVDAKLLNNFPNIKFVAVAFTGYDCVDLDLCREKNIAVFNVPAYSTNSVAELAIGLTISLLREIPATNNIIRSGKWNYRAGTELSGKSIGIVGTGAIGIRVAEIFSVLGCDIYGWSRTEQKEFTNLGGKYIPDLETLCSKVDILSIHVPLTSATKNLINKKHFELMKPTAFLINTARGPIVNQNDLTIALQNKTISGAAIDVYDNEPVAPDDMLLKTTNSILTPHIAYKTNEALKRRIEITFNNIKNFLKGNNENRVD